MKHQFPGTFIVIEGIDGAGKTTQADGYRYEGQRQTRGGRVMNNGEVQAYDTQLTSLAGLSCSGNWFANDEAEVWVEWPTIHGFVCDCKMDGVLDDLAVARAKWIAAAWNSRYHTRDRVESEREDAKRMNGHKLAETAP